MLMMVNLACYYDDIGMLNINSCPRLYLASSYLYPNLLIFVCSREEFLQDVPFVRVQAVAALAKICGSEDLEELREGEQTATEVFEDLLSHDPSGCVSPTSTLLLFRNSFSAMYTLSHYSTFL
jgi:hypothetical protein